MTAPTPPTPAAIRQTQLEWIRDGLKWIVGIATGLLTLSATYFYDRFAQSPRFTPVLWLSWALLIVAALSAILATFSAWQNLNADEDFGPWIQGLYATAMWAFSGAFLALAGFLVLNVLLSHPKTVGEITGVFAVPDTFPAFAPASAAPADPRFSAVACVVRQRLADSGSFSALVIGRADARELSTNAQPRFANNLELAQRRAERVSQFLTDSTLCKAKPLRHVILLTSSWRTSAPKGTTVEALDALLAADRRADVYGFEVKTRVP